MINETCEWTYDEINDVYSTDCPEARAFTGDCNIEYNAFKFCPYCKGDIIIKGSFLQMKATITWSLPQIKTTFKPF